jgi:hypothetical protein
LRDKVLSMNGTLETAGKLSDTTSGIKTFLLKLAGPLWSKKDSIKTIPFSEMGKASHPLFRLKFHT